MPYPRSIFLCIFLLSLLFTSGRTDFLDLNSVADIIGTDTYLRFLTVEKLMQSGSWYDHLIERTNWPHGLTHHWTRPVDLLLLPFAGILPMLEASMLYQFILLLVFTWGTALTTTRLGGTVQNLVLPTILLAVYCNPYLLSYFAPGRIDHHALLATLFVWLLHSLITQRIRTAGIIAGLGVWVSVEFFVPLFFTSLWLGWCWLQKPKEYYRAPRRFFAMMLRIMALGILVERPLSEFTTVVTDSLSWPHFVMIALTCFAAIILSLRTIWKCRLPMRVLKASLLGVAIFLLTFLLFPELLKLGFVTMTDPLLIEYFGDNIGELKSPIDEGYNISPFIPLLLALPISFMRMRKENWPFHALLLLITSVSMYLLTFDAFRWVYYAVPPALLLLAYGLSDVKWEEWRVKRMLVIFTIIVLPLGLLSHKEKEEEIRRAHACNADMTTVIRENLLGKQPLSVAITPNRGYEFLFFTPHRILSANNHRNVDGLGDLLRILHSNNLPLAKQILQKRGIDVIVVCPDFINEDSYLHETHSWLTPRSLEQELEKLKVWDVKFPE